jgi:hypothetical protein
MVMPAVQLRVMSRGFSKYHSGVDLMAPYGSPIRAAAGGTVLFAGWYYAYGKIVDIQHADGIITRYAHMSEFAPQIVPGTPVSLGQVIGKVGTTGRAHGAHVHFEVRIGGHAVDPKPYLGLAACPVAPPLAPLEEARATDLPPSLPRGVPAFTGIALADPVRADPGAVSRPQAGPSLERQDR